MENLKDKQLILMTGGELKQIFSEIIKEIQAVKKEPERETKATRYVIGVLGLAHLFGVSLSTMTKRMKTGIFEQARLMRGSVAFYDADFCISLWHEYKSGRTSAMKENYQIKGML